MFSKSDKVLIIAAHPDDETLGMGGTIHRFCSQGSRVRVVFLSDGVGARLNLRQELNARRAAAISALEKLKCNDVHFYDFPDNAMDSVPLIDIIKKIEGNLSEFGPSILFTHFPQDLNVDHKITSQATLVAARPKPNMKLKSLHYFEVQSSTEWNFGSPQFAPNLFVDISENFDFKMEALREYEVEMDDFPAARSFIGVEALATLRGVTADVSKAEAFQTAYVRE
jgi:LmbE family N-acetylglucosaminyl deacetylase